MLDLADAGRAQQVRQARRRGRAARRAQAVAAQPRRLRRSPDDEVPVFPTIASRFDDPGRERAVRRPLVRAMLAWRSRTLDAWPRARRRVEPGGDRRSRGSLIPAARVALPRRRSPTAACERERASRRAARRRRDGARSGCDRRCPGARRCRARRCAAGARRAAARAFDRRSTGARRRGDASLRGWDERRRARSPPTQYSYTVRGREVTRRQLPRDAQRPQIPKIAPPRLASWGDGCAS